MSGANGGTPGHGATPVPAPATATRPVPADLARNYRVAYLRSLSGRSEGALSDGYALGRVAVEQGVSILEVAELHHELFLAALQETPPGQLAAVATASSAFFLEVLATYDMAQRALRRPGGGGPPPPA